MLSSAERSDASTVSKPSTSVAVSPKPWNHSRSVNPSTSCPPSVNDAVNCVSSPSVTLA